MSQYNSKTDICNLALVSHLKQDPIANFEFPETRIEKLCDLVYDQTRRKVLRMHPWNFASKRTKLALVNETPEFGFEQMFKLPNDYVRFCDAGESGEVEDYQIENFHILTNGESNPLPLRYVYDFVDVRRMDSLFIECLALEIAIKLAFPITGSNDLKKGLAQELNAISPWARAIDGQERPPIRKESSRTLNARFGGYSRGFNGRLR